MVSHCPNCKTIEYMLPVTIRVEKVKNTELTRLVNNTICTQCGLAFADSCIPSQSSVKVNHSRLQFPSPKYTTRAEIARHKLYDRNMYQAWTDVIFELEQTAREQLNSRTYSDYAAHFLYVWLYFLMFARNILKKRIDLVDSWMKGETT